MARKYDSTKRKRAAAETRQSILQAALRLHWQGVTEYEPLAREAGCSLPTVRKHFPTKEALFRGCTRSFADSLTMPDVAALRAISDPATRLEECVSELCRIHEAMFGYAWLSAHQRKQSPTLEEEMTAYEGLADVITEIIAPSNARTAPVVRGLLDFLTYRALRLSGGLTPQATQEELIAILRPLTLSGKSSTHGTGRKERRKR